MKTFRQMTQKGDPVIHIKLPTETIQTLKSQAKQNKRFTQDHFIKMLAETLKNEDALANPPEKLMSNLKKTYLP